MKSLAKWVGVVAAVVLMAGSAAAAETISAGRVKSVNAEKKEFVLTDGAEKDWTFKLGDDVVINRGGKESATGLRANDDVSVCYDKGLRTWTARYVLVREGDARNWQLGRGSFKAHDAAKNEFTYTDTNGKDWTYPVGDAKVRLNKQDGKIEDMKVGDNTLAIVEEVGGKPTLRSVMVRRDK